MPLIGCRRLLVTVPGAAADAIAQHLCAAGRMAEALDAGEVPSFEGYSGALLGNPVRYGSRLREVTDLIAANREALSGMPVVFLTMHMLSLGDDPDAAVERAKYTAKAREQVTPTDEVFFEGMIDTARASFSDRLAVRLVKSPVGDRHGEDQIAAWANAMAPRLVSGAG